MINRLGKIIFGSIILLNIVSIMSVNLLANEDNNEILEVNEYDEIINTLYEDTITSEVEELVLQREFVERFGYNELIEYMNSSQEKAETITWLLNDIETLKLLILGGETNSDYINAIEILHQFKTNHWEDTNNITPLNDANGTVGELAKKMMVSLSLTHADNIDTWISDKDCANCTTALNRYETYKTLYHDNKLNNQIFESLEVEEMRLVMNNMIDDNSITWLNEYSTNNDIEDIYNPYSYISFNDDANYSKEQYYSLETYEQYNAKYNLENYNITNDNTPKLWMVIEDGGNSNTIANFGSNLLAVNGVPSTMVSQSLNVAYLKYELVNNDEAIWILSHDINGWKESSNNVRPLNNWGEQEYVSEYSLSYMILAQAAINDYNNYEKVVLEYLLAQSFNNDKDAMISIYNNALTLQNFNLDIIEARINIILNDEKTTDVELISLIEETITNLKYYPLPMYDLVMNIKNNLTEPSNIKIVNSMLETALLEATNITNEEHIQANAIKDVANDLYNSLEKDYFDFSFDGDKANTIIVSSQYQNLDFEWEFSLDNQNTWTSTNANEYVLNAEELALVNSTDDIIVHFKDQSYDEENLCYIDILSAGTQSSIYFNDFENSVYGDLEKLQWFDINKNEWVNYQDENPLLTEDITLDFRIKAFGKTLPSNTKSYAFTKEVYTPERTYVEKSMINIGDYSTELNTSNYSVNNVIDGINETVWQTNSNDHNKFVEIILNEPIFLSALEYIPNSIDTSNRIKQASIEVSMDQENWESVYLSPIWDNDNTIENMQLETSVSAKYIRFTSVQNYGSTDVVAVGELRVYEDITKKEELKLDVNFSEDTHTSNAVTVTLANTSKELTAVNTTNNELSYTFTENGTFTFELQDELNNTIYKEISVDWIDSTAPTASISYGLLNTESNTVEATINNYSENITILNNNGSDTYVFEENGSFTFIIQDKLGNTSEIVSSVSWLEHKEGIPTLKYSHLSTINHDVKVSVISDDSIKILNNDNQDYYIFTENGEFKFTYQDKDGNIGVLTANVDNIDKVNPTAELEYIEVDGYTVVRLVNPSEKIIIKNNGGKDSYTFTENGTFQFEIEDIAGNVNTIEASVSNIDRAIPKAIIEYSNVERTNEDVIVTLKNPSEEITITNNDGLNTYTFKENGSFTFEYVDSLGNIGEKTITVDWIEPVNNKVETNIPNNARSNSVTNFITENLNELIRNK